MLAGHGPDRDRHQPPEDVEAKAFNKCFGWICVLSSASSTSSFGSVIVDGADDLPWLHLGEALHGRVHYYTVIRTFAADGDLSVNTELFREGMGGKGGGGSSSLAGTRFNEFTRFVC